MATPAVCALCSQSGSAHNGVLGQLIGPVKLKSSSIAGSTCYVHKQCALWSPEVYQNERGALKHLSAAVRRGRQIRCNHCGQPGATIGCRIDWCPASFHLWCAHEAKCLFNVDLYVIACPAHKRLFKNEQRQQQSADDVDQRLGNHVNQVTYDLPSHERITKHARFASDPSLGLPPGPNPKRSKGDHRAVYAVDPEEHVAKARLALALLKQEQRAGRSTFGITSEVVTKAPENLDDDEAEWAVKEKKRLAKDIANLAPIILAGIGGREAAEAVAKAAQAGSRAAQQHPKIWVAGDMPGFESLGGLDHVITSLREMALLPLQHPHLLQRMGIQAPRGILLHGVPGSGKTAAVRALAGECAATARQPISLFLRKGADCLGKYVGDAERTLRLLFNEASKRAPSIIFLDELDALAPARSTRESTQDQVHASVVSTLLTLMDGMNDRGQVLVIAATNRPDTLDPALRRPGRFDREIFFGLPDAAARASILAAQTRDWQPQPSPALISRLVVATEGFAGADLQALCCAAVLAAARRTAPHDILAALQTQPAIDLGSLNPHDVAAEPSTANHQDKPNHISAECDMIVCERTANGQEKSTGMDPPAATENNETPPTASNTACTIDGAARLSDTSPAGVTQAKEQLSQQQHEGFAAGKPVVDVGCSESLAAKGDLKQPPLPVTSAPSPAVGTGGNAQSDLPVEPTMNATGVASENDPSSAGRTPHPVKKRSNFIEVLKTVLGQPSRPPTLGLYSPSSNAQHGHNPHELMNAYDSDSDSEVSSDDDMRRPDDNSPSGCIKANAIPTFTSPILQRLYNAKRTPAVPVIDLTADTPGSLAAGLPPTHKQQQQPPSWQQHQQPVAQQQHALATKVHEGRNVTQLHMPVTPGHTRSEQQDLGSGSNSWVEDVVVTEDDWNTALQAAPKPASQREPLAIIHSSGKDRTPFPFVPLLLPTLAQVTRYLSSAMPQILPEDLSKAATSVISQNPAGAQTNSATHQISVTQQQQQEFEVQQEQQQQQQQQGNTVSSSHSAVVPCPDLPQPWQQLETELQKLGCLHLSKEVNATSQAQNTGIQHETASLASATSDAMLAKGRDAQQLFGASHCVPQVRLLLCGQDGNQDVNAVVSLLLAALQPCAKVTSLALTSLTMLGRDPSAGLSAALSEGRRRCGNGDILVLHMPDIQLWGIQGTTALETDMDIEANGNNNQEEDSNVKCDVTPLWSVMVQSVMQLLLTTPVLVLATCTLPASLLPSEIVEFFKQTSDRLMDTKPSPQAYISDDNTASTPIASITTWQQPSPALCDVVLIRSAETAVASRLLPVLESAVVQRVQQALKTKSVGIQEVPDNAAVNPPNTANCTAVHVESSDPTDTDTSQGVRQPDLVGIAVTSAAQTTPSRCSDHNAEAVAAHASPMSCDNLEFMQTHTSSADVSAGLLVHAHKAGLALNEVELEQAVKAVQQMQVNMQAAALALLRDTRLIKLLKLSEDAANGGLSLQSPELLVLHLTGVLAGKCNSIQEFLQPCIDFLTRLRAVAITASGTVTTSTCAPGHVIGSVSSPLRYHWGAATAAALMDDLQVFAGTMQQVVGRLPDRVQALLQEQHLNQDDKKLVDKYRQDSRTTCIAQGCDQATEQVARAAEQRQGTEHSQQREQLQQKVRQYLLTIVDRLNHVMYAALKGQFRQPRSSSGFNAAASSCLHAGKVAVNATNINAAVSAIVGQALALDWVAVESHDRPANVNGDSFTDYSSYVSVVRLHVQALLGGLERCLDGSSKHLIR